MNKSYSRVLTCNKQRKKKYKIINEKKKQNRVSLINSSVALYRHILMLLKLMKVAISRGVYKPPPPPPPRVQAAFASSPPRRVMGARVSHANAINSAQITKQSRGAFREYRQFELHTRRVRIFASARDRPTHTHIHI